MKQLTKSILFSFLYYSGLLSLYINFALKGKSNLPVVILIYHRIIENPADEISDDLSVNHPLALFKREMRFVRKWFNVVSLDEAVEIIKSRRDVKKPTLAITFDDGFADNYSRAFPVLKRLGLPAYIFLTAGVIETTDLPWVEKIGQVILLTKEQRLRLNSPVNRSFPLVTFNDKRAAFNTITRGLKDLEYSRRISLVSEIVESLKAFSGNRLRLLNWGEIKEMSRENITFGSHTMTHPILSKTPIAVAKEEIRASKEIIEAKLGSAVNHFAFPNGRYCDFSDALRYYCRDLGFKSVLTAEYGSNRLGSNVESLLRVSPGRTMPIFAVDLIRSYLKK